MSERYANARDARFSERLESFVDIVIGFSLAELTLGLTIQAHLTPEWLFLVLVGFGWSFAMTCWIWMLYRSISEDFFVPTRPMIALHLVGLSCVMLLLLGVQFVMRFAVVGSLLADANLATTFYFVILAIVLAVCGAQFLLGRHLRGDALDPVVARKGVETAYRLLTMATFVAVAIAFLPGRGVKASLILLPAMILGAVVGRIINKLKPARV